VTVALGDAGRDESASSGPIRGGRGIMIGMDARFVGIAELAAAPSVAVVVDVMRAFTAAAWAFTRGAEKIVLAGTLDEALALKARHPDWVTLKDGPPAPGFDAVNSPGMLRSADIAGRTVVQKTTYGTAGALAARDASLVLCASFVVAEATAQLLRARASGSVTFVVTGEDGQADEDLACAQYIAGRADGTATDAAAFLRRAAASRSRQLWIAARKRILGDIAAPGVLGVEGCLAGVSRTQVPCAAGGTLVPVDILGRLRGNGQEPGGARSYAAAATVGVLAPGSTRAGQ
jgi:2-phosphosulfolactate phosphatase